MHNTLIDLISCPVDWEKIGPEGELQYWLNFLWYATCHERQVDQEATHSFSDEDYRASELNLFITDEWKIAADLHNTRRWIQDARDKYLSFTQRFVRLGAVGRELYNKHYINRPQSLPDIQTTSVSRGASVLLPALTNEVQESLTWAALDDFVYLLMCDIDRHDRSEEPMNAKAKLLEMFGRHSISLAVDFVREIGASDGRSTRYGCIDFDFSTPQFHLYPIRDTEYECAKFKAYVQGWNYGL